MSRINDDFNEKIEIIRDYLSGRLNPAELSMIESHLDGLEHTYRERVLFDPLTGLRNDIVFRSDIEHQLELAKRGVPFSVFFGDLGALKFVNDNYGRDNGDRLIKFAGEFIQENVRDADLVYRMGRAADEFGFILPKTDESGALVFYNNFKEAAASARPGEVLNLSGEARNLPLIFHLGYVGVDERKVIGVDELLREVDHEMIRDKERNRRNSKYKGFIRS